MPEKPSTAKRPYTPPTLRSHGDLRTLTKGKNKQRQETGGTNVKKTRSGGD